MKSDFAVIIPALNEERHIPIALEALHDIARQAGRSGDVIVVDNGSTDRTAAVARSHGARVIVAEGVNIGQLRNLGVQETDAHLLCFLDADCEVTEEWKLALRDLISNCRRELLTGFPCLCPPGVGRLGRLLATFPRPRASSYIASGNLVVTRDAFELLDGFDQSLATGEDYDFCQRAAAAGLQLERNPRFRAYHHGYPRSIRDYYRRQKWHGRGDFESWESFRKSRPAQIGIAHGVALLLAIVLSLAGWWIALLAYLVTFGGLAVAFSAFRGSRSVRDIPIEVLLFWLYLVARSLAGVDVHCLTRAGRWR